MTAASPCPRGSTRCFLSMRRPSTGFPVPAGIDPRFGRGITAGLRLPRARGDRPHIPLRLQLGRQASPCPRGSTRSHPHGGSLDRGFPVPAGIDPCRADLRLRVVGLPRARGDRPFQAAAPVQSARASPCPRGSTLKMGGFAKWQEGFPVPAGIDLIAKPSTSAWVRLPRARGDRPPLRRRRRALCAASPCPRGSTRISCTGSPCPRGFPVPAGIDPRRTC